jgi:predicted ATP-grasp superfamily ATP-dependent carboligase
LHARISPNLAVIAVCARPYVAAAAQLGYRIAAFDIFNDAQTRRFSLRSQTVSFRDGGFDAEDLWGKLTATLAPGTPVVFGSGLETQPSLLDRIGQKFQLMGNSGEIVGRLKNPRQFFPLLDELGIAYPQVRCQGSGDSEWLIKRIGGSGGTHIREGHRLAEDEYFQRRIVGKPVSVLCLSNGAETEVVGFNEQWVSPTERQPYRFGGIVGNVQLPQGVKASMSLAANKLAQALGLRGLFSLDFIRVENRALLLEVNPRLSASFDLYPQAPLLERHIHACQGEALSLLPSQQLSRAAHILYAAQPINIPGFRWPEWTTDTRDEHVQFSQGEPVCTVQSEAADAEAAKALVFARARELDAQLRTLTRPPGK